MSAEGVALVLRIVVVGVVVAVDEETAAVFAAVAVAVAAAAAAAVGDTNDSEADDFDCVAGHAAAAVVVGVVGLPLFCRYAFPFVCSGAGTRFHDFHHTKNTGAYGRNEVCHHMCCPLSRLLHVTGTCFRDTAPLVVEAALHCSCDDVPCVL